MLIKHTHPHIGAFAVALRLRLKVANLTRCSAVPVLGASGCWVLLRLRLAVGVVS
jgi:hypothetical protein